MLKYNILYVIISGQGGAYKMFAVNYSTLRDTMKEYFDQVADGFETMIVTRKKSNMVIMSEDSYNSLLETVYLLGNKENSEHLMKSISQYRYGKASVHELTED